VCRFITIMVLRLLRRCECVVATPSQREKGGRCCLACCAFAARWYGFGRTRALCEVGSGIVCRGSVASMSLIQPREEPNKRTRNLFK